MPEPPADNTGWEMEEIRDVPGYGMTFTISIIAIVVIVIMVAL